MAESPVLTVARLLGGVVLLNGNLGHQVLGQLLITNSNEVAIAGAAAAVAATSGQQNAAAQIAIRTAVPALAVRGLLLKQEQRIERRETLVAERERELNEFTHAKKKSDQTIKTQKMQIDQAIAREAELGTRLAVLKAESDETIKTQKKEIEQGITQVTELGRRLAVLEAESDETIKTQKKEIEQGITQVTQIGRHLAVLEAERDETIKTQKTQIDQAIAREAELGTRLAVLEAEKEAATSTIAALGNRNQELVTEIGAFRADVVRQSGLNIDDPYRPPKSTTRKKKTSTPPRTRKPRKPKA